MIHVSIYQKPSLLGFKTGIQNYDLDILKICLLVGIPFLIIDRIIVPNYFLISFLYATSYIFVQNIRVNNYLEKKFSQIIVRSIVIFIFNVLLLIYLTTFTDLISLNYILIPIIIIRIPFIFFEWSNLFKPHNQNGDDAGLQFLINSFFGLVRLRLPFVALLPFGGLGFLGIYEIFRNITEIYMSPAKSVYLIIQRNIQVKNPGRVFLVGAISGFIMSLVALITVEFVLNFDFFYFENLESLILVFIVSSFVLLSYISDTTSILLQYNRNIELDIKFKIVSIVVFLLAVLIFLNLINLEIYLYLVLIMYFLHIVLAIPSLKNHIYDK